MQEKEGNEVSRSTDLPVGEHCLTWPPEWTWSSDVHHALKDHQHRQFPTKQSDSDLGRAGTLQKPWLACFSMRSWGPFRVPARIDECSAVISATRQLEARWAGARQKKMELEGRSPDSRPQSRKETRRLGERAGTKSTCLTLGQKFTKCL